MQQLSGKLVSQQSVSVGDDGVIIYGFWSISSADVVCFIVFDWHTHFCLGLPLKRHLAMILTISHLSGHPFICHVFVSRCHVCKISLETRTFLWHVDQKNFVTKTTWCWMKLVRPLLTFFCYGWDCLLKKRETCSPSQNHGTLIWQSRFEIVWLVRNRKWVWSKQVNRNVALMLLCNRQFLKKTKNPQRSKQEVLRKCKLPVWCRGNRISLDPHMNN